MFVKTDKDGNFIRKVSERPNGDGTWTVRHNRLGTVATIPGTRNPVSHRGTKVPQRMNQRDAHDFAEEINWS